MSGWSRPLAKYEAGNGQSWNKRCWSWLLYVRVCVCIYERHVFFSGPFSLLTLVLQTSIKTVVSDRAIEGTATNDTQDLSGEQTHL